MLTKLKGPMAIGSLDLIDQDRLTATTRQFFSLLLHDTALASEMVVTQVRQFFPDWQAGETALDPSSLTELATDKSIRDYLIALIFDLAHADPDQTEEMLARGGKFAAAMDWETDYRGNLKALLKMRKPQIDRILSASKKVAWEFR